MAADFSHKIVIAGAGISGLSVGTYLKDLGYNNITFIEASDSPGGRLKTELIDGYTLNHGLHLFNTAYPVAKELLDYSKLDLRYFSPGALIIKNGKLIKIVEALKKSFFAYKILFSNYGTLSDKFKFVKMRMELNQLSEDEIFEKYEIKTSTLLRKKNFTSKIVNTFFRPYFSSFFMEDELTASRRLLDFSYKMITEGRLCIPAKGIQDIPNQLASRFRKEDFIFNTRALDFKENKVMLDNGQSVDADIFVVATEKNELFSKIKQVADRNNHRSSTCLYFSADKKPFFDPMICVSSNEPKLVSSLVVLTNVSKGYAPKGKELISVSLNGLAKADDALVEKEVKDELHRVFGSQVNAWKLLKIYRIDYALPNQDHVLSKRRTLDLKSGKNIYFCGDHLFYGNINGAMKSGKVVAQLIHKDFNQDNRIEKRLKYSKLFDNKV